MYDFSGPCFIGFWRKKGVVMIRAGISLKELEAKHIEYTLQLMRYNKSRTAKILGISRGCLQMKLKQYFGEEYVKSRV